VRLATVGPFWRIKPLKEQGSERQGQCRALGEGTGEDQAAVYSRCSVRKVKSGEIAARCGKELAGLKPACYYGVPSTRYPMDVEIGDSVENPRGWRCIGLWERRRLKWGTRRIAAVRRRRVNDNILSVRLMSNIMKDAVVRGANCFERPADVSVEPGCLRGRRSASDTHQ